MKRSFVLILVLLALVACDASSPASSTAPVPDQVPPRVAGISDGHSQPHIDPLQANADIQIVLVPSELIVGPNRFAVGLLKNNQALLDATVHFHYYDLGDLNRPVLESEADAVRLQTPDGLTAIWAQEREFTRSGDWGVEVQARLAGDGAAIRRLGFHVTASSNTVKPGQKAPSVETLSVAAVGNDLRRLTSAVTPNAAFYRQSLAQALNSGKPTALLFATPAFCQTRFCGPAYEIASALQKRYGETINFVHVEVFDGLPNPATTAWHYAPAMQAYGLTTEPWLFLINRSGIVTYRVEGLFTEDEVNQHIRALVAD
ncbi:MAG: hypothetical protein HYR71_06915 [Chloroflexi bacterium]|nr:hypothetical protein [Chloroflexota bacterium]